MNALLTIDGSQGEGGGQVLRTALAVALVTGRPFHIDRIRAGRSRPGLLRQHLTSVQAAAAIGRATVDGAEPGGSTLTFTPGAVTSGEYHFAVGTAGSATLVLQTVLPALLLARGSSRVVVEGGTHNPMAPPFDFLDRTWLPIVRRMGGRVTLALERHGFHPAGGGRIVAAIDPVPRLEPVTLLERGPVTVSARALVSGIADSVAARELRVVHERLGVAWEALEAVTIETSPGPGNALLIALASTAVTEVVTGFGEKNVGAGTVAGRACDEAQAYIDAGVPVGSHLADQLLVPLALAGGGVFRTLPLSRHATTNVAVLRQFLDVDIACADEPQGTCMVTVSTPDRA